MPGSEGGAMDYEITAVMDRYKSVCSKAGRKTNDFIIASLEKEVDETSMKPAETMFLRLCGNNFMLTDTRLTDADVELLMEGLSHNEYILRLDLRYNNITDKGAMIIAQHLEKNPFLREIDLMNNDIEEAGALALAKSLQSNQNLRSLKLNGNKIGRRGGMAFAQVLQVNTSLVELDLGETDQKIDSLIAMATVLRENTSMKAVNMNRPLLFTQQEEHVVHYANMLKENRMLAELHLQKCDLKDFGAERLSEALMDNMFLTYLDVSCNRITRDGAKKLGKLLERNSVLRVLDMGYNRIEDDGATDLATALNMMNASLQTLVVKHNNIGDAGLCALADAMTMNTTLTRILIWGNHWEPKAASKFRELTECGRFSTDDVDFHPYVVDDVTYLAEVSMNLRRWYYTEPFYKPAIVDHKSIDQRYPDID